jgi:two-component system, oxyanion-binding sensor
MTGRRAAGLQKVRVGFVPLVDAALLVAAREIGFAAGEGLDLLLVRETAWSAVRDRLNVGLLDAAHMLAPAAVASHLGLGHLHVPLVAPAALNLDGNAITLGNELAEMLARDFPPGLAATPAETARAFARLVADRRREGLPPFVAAVVFDYSSHLLQLRHWLSLGGVVPEDAVRFVVIPPALMVESLGNGLIDLYCAGAPWNRLAETRDAGKVLHRSADILPGSAEKLLVARSDQAEAVWLLPLVRAIRAAAAWAADPAHLPELARLLSRQGYLDVPEALVAGILAGTGATLADPTPSAWIRLDDDATRPSPERLAALLDGMRQAGQIDASPATAERAMAMLRPDLHAAAE